MPEKTLPQQRTSWLVALRHVFAPIRLTVGLLWLPYWAAVVIVAAFVIKALAEGASLGLVPEKLAILALAAAFVPLWGFSSQEVWPGLPRAAVRLIGLVGPASLVAALWISAALVLPVIQEAVQGL